MWFTLSDYGAFARVIVSQSLLDSIIANTIEKTEVQPSLGISAYTERFILKIQQDTKNKNNIFFSCTYVLLRKDYPEDACIYFYKKQCFFILFDDVTIDNTLEKVLKCPDTEPYHQVMDSLDFTYRKPGGVIFERRKLVVYKISKTWYSNRKYKITSKTYIPFSTAPQKFWPINSFSELVVPINSFSSFYIDERHRFTDLYYKEVQPILPVKILIKRK